MSPRPIVWSIAGSDSGGGAGLQADLKAFEAFDVHGCTAVAAITAQNSVAVRARRRGVAPICSTRSWPRWRATCRRAAIKTGMLGSAANVRVRRARGSTDCGGCAPGARGRSGVACDHRRDLGDDALLAACCSELLPRATRDHAQSRRGGMAARPGRIRAGDGRRRRTGRDRVAQARRRSRGHHRRRRRRQPLRATGSSTPQASGWLSAAAHRRRRTTTARGCVFAASRWPRRWRSASARPTPRCSRRWHRAALRRRRRGRARRGPGEAAAPASRCSARAAAVAVDAGAVRATSSASLAQTRALGLYADRRQRATGSSACSPPACAPCSCASRKARRRHLASEVRAQRAPRRARSTRAALHQRPLAPGARASAPTASTSGSRTCDAARPRCAIARCRAAAGREHARLLGSVPRACAAAELHRLRTDPCDDDEGRCRGRRKAADNLAYWCSAAACAGGCDRRHGPLDAAREAVRCGAAGVAVVGAISRAPSPAAATAALQQAAGGGRAAWLRGDRRAAPARPRPTLSTKTAFSGR